MKPPVSAILWVLSLALLAGCSTSPTQTSGTVVVDGEPDYGGKQTEVIAPPPAAATPAGSVTPYASLVKRATDARDAGDYDQALALLERAQRIDPDSAEIYLALAQTHRERGDLTQSRATAERGLLYCASPNQCNALRAYTK